MRQGWDLLLKMGEKNSDGGQFFTPREVIRGMVHILDPQAGETVYDPCRGTGGFLAVAFEHIKRNLGNAPACTALDKLKHDTFFGREKENLVFFTKGKKTERIWYYDLSQIKVGKKTPMTLAYFGFDKHGKILDVADLPVTLTGDWLEQAGNQGKPFPTLARLLAISGTPDVDSDFSWTIDFIARRVKAHEDMTPFLEAVKKLTEELILLKEELKALKKDKSEKEAIAVPEETIKTKEKAIRDAQANID